MLAAADAVGGRTTSFSERGYQIEKGATQLSTGYAAYLALAEEVGLGDQIAECGNTIMPAPLASKLRYNRAVNVYLGYTKRTDTDALGVLVPTAEDSQIGLVWLDHNKLAETAPPGHSLITCYFEEGGLDTVTPATDLNFVEIAAAFVEKLFPELAGTRDMATVVRWQAAIPNPAPGIYRATHEMKQRLDPAFPIQLAGAYFTCTGQNSAIHWGQVAADNIHRAIGRRNQPPA